MYYEHGNPIVKIFFYFFARPNNVLPRISVAFAGWGGWLTRIAPRARGTKNDIAARNVGFGCLCGIRNINEVGSAFLEKRPRFLEKGSVGPRETIRKVRSRVRFSCENR
jgi:hypothetical protein